VKKLEKKKIFRHGSLKNKKLLKDNLLVVTIATMLMYVRGEGLFGSKNNKV
jgi:hypothetical protein